MSICNNRIQNNNCKQCASNNAFIIDTFIVKVAISARKYFKTTEILKL